MTCEWATTGAKGNAAAGCGAKMMGWATLTPKCAKGLGAKLGMACVLAGVSWGKGMPKATAINADDKIT